MPSDVLITPASSKIDFTDGANSTKRLNISGTAFSFNSNLNVLSTTSLSSAFKAEGVNGTLFEVTDDLSNSLMSVNTISGLPVFEVFANNSIIGGQYGANDFVISGNKIGLGYASPVNKLSVSGSVSIGSSYNVAAPSNGLIVQGDVGIGTATPTSQTNYRFLQVNGPVSAIIETTVAGVRIGGFDSTSNTLYVGTIGAFPIVFRTGVDEKWRITNAGVLQSSTAQTIQTATGILTLATLAGDGHIVLSPHGNGNVGVKTATPGQALEVNGRGLFTGATVASAGSLQVTSADAALRLKWTTSPVADKNTWDIRSVGTGNIPHLQFRTINDANTVFTNRVAFTNDGDVGIATATPRGKLEINNAGDSRLIVYETGTAPYTATLELSSQTYGTYGGTIQYNASPETLTIENYGRTATNSVQGSILFKTKINNTTATNVMAINGFTGNVGIGVISPRVLLDLAKANNVGQVLLLGETGANIRVGFGLAPSNAGMRIFSLNHITDGLIEFGGISSSDGSTWTRNHRLGLAGANSFFNEQGGNVGIGIITPSYKLDVNGTTRFGGIVYNEAVQTDDFNYFNLQPYIESETLSSILSAAGTAPTFVTLTNTTAPFSKVLSVSAYGEATMSELIPVQAGETIYGEIWAYRATGATGTAGVLYCGVQRYDKDKKMIDGNAGLNTPPSGYFIASNQTIPSNSTWTKYSGTLVLPTSHTVYNGSDGGPVRYIRPYIIYNYTGGTILTYIGGWKIRKVELTRDLGIVSINGSVGVGTISPNEKLSVYPGITGGIALQAGDGTTRSYYFIDNTNPTYSTGIRTNNYYLDFDSSGASQNAIRFYTGTSTIGTGTERMRITSNGNIGIGLVTSPNHLLHLSTVSNDVSIGLYTTNANASARNWLISTNEIAYGDFNIKQSNAIGGNPRSAGTSRFYIQNDGNVGIGGATSPIGKLQLGADYANDGYGGYDVYVKSTTAGTLSSYDPRVQNTSIFSLLITDSSSTTNGPDKIGLVLHNNNATAGAFSPMLLFTKKESGSTPYKATMAGIYARSPLGTGDTDSWIDGELIFATAGAASEGIKQRMVINKEGYVGIGITIPTAKLDVLGVRLGRDFSLANRATVRLDSNGIAYPSDVLFGHTAAANQDGWTSVYWSLSSRADANSNRFYFYRGGGHPVPNNSEAVIMSFDPNLNVGVGFEAPTNRLSIAGSVSIGSNYNTAATTNGLIVEGNVGVGVTVPTAKLDVTGSNTNGYSLLLRSGDNYNGTDSVQIAFGFANQTNYRHSIRTRHNPLAPISGVVGNNIDFYAWKRGTDAAGDLGSQFVMTMQGDGYVGIGITNPLAKLHINSTTSGETLLRADGTNGTLFSVVDDLSDSLMSVNNSAGLPVLEVFADDRVVAGQYGANDFVLRNNKLGLGTSNPVYRLNVYDISSGSVDEVFAGTIGNDQVVGGRTGGSFGISTKSTSNGNLILTANSAMYLRTGGGNDRVFIKSDGNVGIGTVSPAEKLDVSGSIIANSIASTDYTRQLFPSGGYFYAGGAQTGAIKIKLPANTKSTFPMLSFTCHIYNYSTGTSRTFKIGGHFSTSSWYNPFAYCLSDNVGNLNVRWGFEGTSICVWIGETNSGWSYPNVFITDFQNGYSSISNIWMTGWTVSLATAFDTITNGPYAPGYFWNQNNDGAGSGLDADLLDGYNSATANTANTIVLRDGSGNFSAGTITASLTGSVSGTAGSETFATVTGRGSGTATQISVATTSAGSMVTGEKLGSGYSDGVSGATFKSITNHPTGASYAFASYFGGLLGTNSFYVSAEGGAYFKNNVGIGTTSPNNKLVVVAGGDISGINLSYDASTNNRTGLFAWTRGSSLAAIGGGVDYTAASTFTARSTAASYVEFGSGATRFYGNTSLTSGNGFTPTERMCISAIGNVGIGTTAPASNLEVRGATDLALAAVGLQTQLWVSDNTNQTTGVGGGISFAGKYITSNATQITFGAIRGSKVNTTSADTLGHLELYAFGGDFKFHSQTNQLIGANAVLMTIKANGNVGVGTPIPTARLDVRPTTATAYQGTVPYQTTTAAILSPVMAAASVDTYTSILQLVSVRQALVAGRYAHGYLGFSTVDNSNVNGILDAGRISIKNDDGVGLHSATAMGFWTNPGGSASTAAIERVRIASDGNVGIGITSPSSKLDVVGSARLSANLLSHKTASYTTSYPGINSFGADATDSSITYYDTGKTLPNVSFRGVVWTGKHYIFTTASSNLAYFYDNNFNLITNSYGLNSVSLPLPSGYANPHGAAWDGRYLWVVCYVSGETTASKIVGYDLDLPSGNAAIIAESAPLTNITATYDIEYADGHFYMVRSGNVYIYRWNGSTIDLINTIVGEVGTITAQAITYDGSYLWVTQNGQPVYKLGLDGYQETSITSGFPPDTCGWAWNGSNIVSFDYSTRIIYIINTTRLRIDTQKLALMGGNVGIGITSPSAKLNISLAGVVANTLSLINVGSWGNNTVQLFNSNGGTTGNEVLLLGCQAGGNGQLASGFGFGRESSATWGTYISLKTHSPSTSVIDELYERVRIAADGNVGIGNITPANKLAVSGSVSIGSNYNVAAPTNGLIVEGSVGIGTTSPAAKLHLSGTGATELRITSTTANTNSLLSFYESSLASWGIDAGQANGSFFIKDLFNTRTVLTLNSVGSVGIGTTVPADKLDVVGRVYAHRYIAVSSNAASPAYATDTNTGMFNAASNQIGFSISSAEKVRIDSNGNLGIGTVGTTGPSNKLHVWAGTIQVSGFPSIAAGPITFLKSDYNGSAAVQINFLNFNPSNGYDSDLGIQLMNTSAAMVDVLRIKGSTGNVGIGTVTPTSKLHLNSTTSGAILLKADGTNGTLFSVSDDLSNSLMSVNTISGLPVFEVFANNSIIAGQYGQNDFVISGNKVGIGTASPIYKLDVYGSSNSDVGRFYNNSASCNFYIGSTNNTSATALVFYTSNGNGQIFKNRSSTGWGGADSFNIYSSNGAIAFHPAGTTNALYIANNGNVSLGSSTAATLLHIGTGNPTAATGGIQFGDDATARIYRIGPATIQISNNLTVGGTITGSLTGNAATATARNINGTSFDHSADITTASWGTARTLTIGSAGKSVNGSAAVSWTLAEIGAVPTAGGTMTGVLTTYTPGVQTSITNLSASNAGVVVGERNVGSAAGFVPGFGQTTLHTGGYRSHMILGSYRTANTWGGGPFIAWGGNDNYPTEYWLFNQGGAITHSGGKTMAYTDQSFFIGTTSIAINRASGAGLALNGIASIDGSSGSCTGNAATATNLSTNRTNWSTNGTITAVVGQLSWKHYGNNHTIIDASNSTSPAGGAINNTNPDTAWAATYPTLMGWNGANTYGVRVDSARYADNVTGTVAVANGGTGGITQAAARTGLGATTVGSNLFTVANPSADTYIKVNAANTVSLLSAADFKTALGIGTSSTGTVTNVSVVSANGFNGSVNNSNTTPAITLSTTITGILKGNGTAISAATAETDYLIPNTNINVNKLTAAQAIIQKKAEQTNISGAVTIDVSTANVHVLTLNNGANVSSITYNNRAADPAVNTILLVIKYLGTSATINWTNVIWANGNDPTLTKVNGYADVYALTSYKGASGYWIGTVVAQNLVSTNL